MCAPIGNMDDFQNTCLSALKCRNTVFVVASLDASQETGLGCLKRLKSMLPLHNGANSVTESDCGIKIRTPNLKLLDRMDGHPEHVNWRKDKQRAKQDEQRNIQ
jgi:hypothetical protein